MAQYKPGIRTKLNIYHTCERLFYEKGYDDTSISDINASTGTKKSSFYHHYDNKLAVGVAVYDAFTKRTARTASLFGNSIDSGMNVCLDLRTFWSLFYRDANIRRFCIDLSNINLLHLRENSYIYNACLNLSRHEIDAYEIRFISSAIGAITKQLNLDAMHLTSSETELSDYNIRYVFNLFDIENETVDEYVALSRQLFSLCTILNDRFFVTARLTHSINIEKKNGASGIAPIT